MQQAYRALRIVAEAQTLRIVLATDPDELMLNELVIACDSLNKESGSGIKAVVLDFDSRAAQFIAPRAQRAIIPAPRSVETARAAVRANTHPVMAVAPARPS